MRSCTPKERRNQSKNRILDCGELISDLTSMKLDRFIFQDCNSFFSLSCSLTELQEMEEPVVKNNDLLNQNTAR